MSTDIFEYDEKEGEACYEGFIAHLLHLHRGKSLQDISRSYLYGKKGWAEGAHLAHQLCEKHDLSIIARIGYARGTSARVWAEQEGIRFYAERDATHCGLGWFYQDATDPVDENQCAWHWQMRRTFLKNWQRGRQGHTYRPPR